MFLTEYIMATNAISGLSLQALKFPSANKQSGADIIIPHKLFKNTTISSEGYVFITWACKMPQISKLASKMVSH
jgi:hypothetical protein